jgi:hypothetical protein
MLEQTTKEKVIAALRKSDRPELAKLVPQLGVPLTDLWCLYQVEALKSNPHHNANRKTGKALQQLRLHPGYSNTRIAKIVGCNISHIANCIKLLEYLRADPATAPDYGPIKRCRAATAPEPGEVEAEVDMVQPAPEVGKLTGGSSDYYKVLISNPTSGGPGYAAECNDIIEALDMTFAEGNIMKALWRRAAERNGNGKPGTTSVYDAEKIVFFAQRLLTQSK